MPASTDLRCNVCLEDYSTTNVPRNLTCGHSVCLPCLDEIIILEDKCPECRQEFQAVKASELPVNFPMLRMSQINNLVHFDPENIPVPKMIISRPAFERPESAGMCCKHGYSLFFRCLRCCVWVCRDCLLECHPDPPYGRCIVVSIQKALDKIKLSHKRTLEFYLSDVQPNKIKLQHNIRGLSTASKFCRRDKNGNGNKEYWENLEEFIRQKEFAETQLLVSENVTELLKQASEKMNKANDRYDIMATSDFATECETTYEKFMDKERNRKFQGFLNPFLHGKKDLKDLVETEKRVYAVLKEDGRSRWSPLELRDNSILMYSLRDGNPPEEGITLPFELLRVAVPQDFPSVFMELGIDGKSQGFIHVQMFGDTPRGRQTLLLCSGERGASYRETAFFSNTETEDEEEDDFLTGGDYENNNGTGGRAIVDDITDDDIYKHEIEAGMFAGWPVEDPWRLGSFIIYLFNDCCTVNNYVHGTVTKGKKLLYKDILLKSKDRQVRNCGLVIPF